MEIRGTFKTIEDKLVEVVFYGHPEDTRTINIDESEDVYFAENPVSIEYGAEDMFQTIISTSCKISLITKTFLGDMLYANNEHDIRVEVKLESVDYAQQNKMTTIFAGFVEPNVYSQSYANQFEQLDIVCTDWLSNLQYVNVYELLNGSTEPLSIVNLLGKYVDKYVVLENSEEFRMLCHVNRQTCFYSDYGGDVWSGYNAPINYPISLFYDDVVEDSSTLDEVFDEMLKFENMKLVQHGSIIYIINNSFDYSNIYRTQWFSNCEKISNSPDEYLNGKWDISLSDYEAFATDIEHDKRFSFIVNKDKIKSDDISITLDDIYNQIQVQCELEPVENMIESPFDDDYISSKYKQKQLYMTEYTDKNIKSYDCYLAAWSHYDHLTPSLAEMVLPQSKGWDESKQKYYAWYIRQIENKNWNFYNSNGTNINDFLDKDIDGNYINQHRLLQLSGSTPLFPCMVAFGKSENYVENAVKGLKPQTVDMNNYIVYSICGDGSNFPSTETLNPEVQKSAIQYNSGKTFSLSPVDDTITNYIVFSGSLFLQGLQEFTNTKYNDPNITSFARVKPSKAAVETADGKQFDTVVFYEFETPKINYYTKEDGNRVNDNISDYLIPPTENAPKKFQYNYNSNGNNRDMLDFVPVFECELKVGDKYLCEYYDDFLMKKCYRWADGKNKPFPKVYDGDVAYDSKTFAIGFNPKIGDFIIGQEYEFANTVTLEHNLEDAKGIAIPIKASDNLVGKVEFKILGPINTTFNDVVRRHPTWFRHSKYTDNYTDVLPHVQNIYIKDFECKIYTDNAKLEQLEDKDLIYVSAENHNAKNKKDDITFKFNSEISAKDAYDLGMKNTVNLSTPTYLYDSSKNITRKVTTIRESLTGQDIEATPEELYIQEQYNNYKRPKLLVEMDIDWDIFDLESIYVYAHNKETPFIRTEKIVQLHSIGVDTNKRFIIIGESIDVKNHVARTKFREI